MGSMIIITIQLRNVMKTGMTPQSPLNIDKQVIKYLIE